MEDTNVPSNESEIPTRMELLSAAFDKQVEASNEVSEVIETPIAEVHKEEVEHDAENTKSTQDDEHEADTDADEKTEAPVALKAPQSWSPSVREKYESLPDEVKSEINRREVEINKRMQETSTDRKFATEMKSLFKPYELDIQAIGVSPQAVVADLLNVSNTLRRGDQNAKAKMITDIIKQHNVDLETLDRMLAGAPQTQSTQVDSATNSRLAQLEQAEQNRAGQSKAQADAAAVSEINRFTQDPKNEFFNDVMPQMQHLLNSGQSETLKDAYDKAIWSNPETRKILLSRQGQTQQKLNAASSVKSTGPRGQSNVAAPKYKDRLSALEAAYDRAANTETKRV